MHMDGQIRLLQFFYTLFGTKSSKSQSVALKNSAQKLTPIFADSVL
jgi:hypothetical protein